MLKPTIADIANNQATDNHYFDKKTMKWFNQTRRSFSVFRTEDPEIFGTSAVMKDHNGQFMGISRAYWKKSNGTWLKVEKP